ncbi:MAG TPA: glycosyltransferase family 4 protein [Hyphomicrobium sp.]
MLAGNTVEDRLTAGKFAALAPKLTLGISRVPMKRTPGLGDFAAVHAVFRRAGDLDLDVVHGHGAKGCAYARLAAYGLSVSDRDVKAFYTPHGGSLNFKPRTLESRLLLSVERSLESMTTGLIFESDYAARTYGSHVGSMGAPQRVIPNGLRTQDFAPVATRDDATDVLFVGELRAIKGVDVLLKAIAELKSSRPITATIVGSGPDGQGLRSFASNLGLDDLVTFTGAMPAREAFTLGRVMIVPSRAESFPYVVLEAAAARNRSRNGYSTDRARERRCAVARSCRHARRSSCRKRSCDPPQIQSQTRLHGCVDVGGRSRLLRRSLVPARAFAAQSSKVAEPARLTRTTPVESDLKHHDREKFPAALTERP